jgi:hypothetical protein
VEPASMHENKILAAPIENKVAEIEAAERPERIPTGDVGRVYGSRAPAPRGYPPLGRGVPDPNWMDITRGVMRQIR